MTDELTQPNADCALIPLYVIDRIMRNAASPNAWTSAVTSELTALCAAAREAHRLREGIEAIIADLRKAESHTPAGLVRAAWTADRQELEALLKEEAK